MATLSELKARVDGASGPSHELDALIEIAARNVQARRSGVKPEYWAKWTVIRDFWVEDPHTRYQPNAVTASIDAALALVERVLPGAKVIVERGYTGDGRASLLPSRDGFPQFHTVADTPPLAILSALLSALIDQEKQDD